jgi:hypothetical protein
MDIALFNKDLRQQKKYSTYKVPSATVGNDSIENY